MTSFYQSLPSFSDFGAVARSESFAAVPGDWLMAVADVRGSTQAIAEGRYRDVNTLGAAVIVAVTHMLGHRDFPSVFGGDGAVCVVPPESRNRVAQALAGVRAMASRQFGLELRVGLVPVRDVVGGGLTLEVGKYELAAGRCIALFRGGGVSRAEELLKTQLERYEIPEPAAWELDLSGLSCRWEPIPSRQGRVVTLLVRAAGKGAAETYRLVLDSLSEILGGQLQNADPVNEPAMRYKSVAACLKEERRYHASVWSLAYARRVFEILIAVPAFKRGTGPFDVKGYRHSMARHSDFRKFDDMLRMVLDCTVEQVAALRRLLEAHQARGELYYGLHEADSSLMTCFVGGLAEGEHIHFIDGGNGGYAVAARHLKARVQG